MRPSFSDNFDTIQPQQQPQQALLPAAALSKGNNYNPVSQQLAPNLLEDGADTCGGPLSELDQLASNYQKECGSYLGGRQTPHSTGSLSAQGGYPCHSNSSPLSNASSSRYNMSDQMPGFDDDFAQLSQPVAVQSMLGGPNSASSSRMSSTLSASHQTSSPHAVPTSTADVYDKYAVFRELQFEEELVNAWKSPTEEIGKEEEMVGNQETEEVQEYKEEEEITEDFNPEQQEEEPGEEYQPDGSQTAEDTEVLMSGSRHFPLTSQALYDFSPQNRLLPGRSGSTLDSEDEFQFGNREDGNRGTIMVEGGEARNIQSSSINNRSGHSSPEIMTIQQKGNVVHDDVQPDWARFDESSAAREEVNDNSFEFSAFLSQEEQANILGVYHNNNNNNHSGPDQYQQADRDGYQEYQLRDFRAELTDPRGASASPGNPPQHFADSDNNGGPGQNPNHCTREMSSALLTPPPPAQYQSFELLEQQEEPEEEITVEREMYLAVEVPDESRQLVAAGDLFESGWEPGFYQGETTRAAVHREVWDLSFQREEEAPGPRRKTGSVAAVVRDPKGTTLNIEEAFPIEEKYHQLGTASPVSTDSLFAANPFNDNFVPSNGNGGGGAGTSSATPPLFLYDGDRLSNASDLSYQSGEGHEAVDIFAKESGFSDLTFRIEAKTKLCKSDSINIFAVSEDPFDDDFFK
jgi:hypothetical protein